MIWYIALGGAVGCVVLSVVLSLVGAVAGLASARHLLSIGERA